MGRNRPPRRPGARPPGLARVHPDTGGVRADSVSRDEKGRRGDRIAGLARHGGYICRRLGCRPRATANGRESPLGGRGQPPPAARPPHPPHFPLFKNAPPELPSTLTPAPLLLLHSFQGNRPRTHTPPGGGVVLSGGG